MGCSCRTAATRRATSRAEVFQISEYPGKKFWGVVTRIANTASNLTTLQLTSDQVTNFEVRILMSQSSYKDLQTSDERSPFRAGLSASVEVKTNTIDNVLTVPIAAVTAREKDKDDLKKKRKKDQEKEDNDSEPEDLNEYVFIQVADSVKMMKVVTGIQDDEYIQITEGLDKEQSVVIAPYEAISKKLESGDKIEVVEEKDLYDKNKK